MQELVRKIGTVFSHHLLVAPLLHLLVVAVVGYGRDVKRFQVLVLVLYGDAVEVEEALSVQVPVPLKLRAVVLPTPELALVVGPTAAGVLRLANVDLPVPDAADLVDDALSHP